jgi:hypothetical protein
MNQDSVVGIVIRLQAGGPRNRGLIVGKGKRLSFHSNSIQNCSVCYFSVSHVKLSIVVPEKCLKYCLLTCNACSPFFQLTVRIHDT